jgi:hypothetical protein
LEREERGPELLEAELLEADPLKGEQPEVALPERME